MKFIIIFFFLIFSTSLVSGTVVDFSERYQDYQGTWHKYTESNVHDYPMYSQIINGSKWDFTTLKDTISIPTTFDLTLSDTKISPSMTFPKTQLVSRMINYNATVAYLVFPYSLSRVKNWSDEHNIKLGRWKFDTAITIYDNNATPNYLNQSAYDFKIVDDEIRLYFIISEANKLIGNITVQMNSWTIDNATTSGFTSANVSLNGSRWTDSGQLAINLRNDSSLNMSGLVAYWSMDENTGTIVHQVNTESGVVNTTNQGTWNGNTTLNYSSGVIGNALAFDGVNDYFEAGDDASLNITDAITISAWVKLSNITTNQVIVAKTGLSLTSQQYNLRVFSGQVQLLATNGTVTFTASKTMLANQWVYVTGTIENNVLTMYMNGVTGAGNSATLTGTKSISTSSVLIGAGDSASVQRYINGSIDEVRIYNRALSADEIAILYNTSLRTQAMPVIWNQTASAGNVINRTRIVYSGQNSTNNASIYARQNGTTSWSLIQVNVTSNTWYNITNQYNSMDFAIQLQGNGSNTPFFTSLEYDEGSDQVNSWTIDNATTSGFTSANVSLNGSRWTDSGQLAINHKNDAALNISGLVAYWSMDENTGTIVHQVNTESGVVNTTNQGTWNGNTTLNYSTGVIGNALQFDGVDDYVNAGNDASLNITSSFSATAWIKPTVGSDSGIISKDGISGNRGRYLLLMADGTLRSLISSNGTLITYFATTKIVNSSVWQHVATVYDASAQTLKVYINGVDESGTLTGTIPASINVCTISNRIGSRSTSYLNGSIDEVRIYNRALSAEEIAVLYNTSMRTQAMPVIMNQTASAGKQINRVRILFTGQDNTNNVSLYANKSNVPGRVIIVSNMTSNTWYLIPTLLQNQTMDFGILMQGNGSNSPFFTSLEYDEGSDQVNPFVAVGIAAMGIAVSIALYNMYRRRGRPMMFIPGVI